ncbi:MAG: transglycosylase domain-containing protein [Mesorhizobium sp.]
MARGRNTRIEPTFDGPPSKRRNAGLSVSEDDRAVPSPRKQKRAKAKPAAKTRGRTRRGFGLLGGLFYWSIVLCLWGGIAAAGLVAYYGARMPSAITWTVPDRPPNVKIMSVDKQLLANRGMTGGEAVSLSDMSPYIPQAVIAIEDRRFRSHFGVDPLGLARAMVTNVTSGRFAQGGSTLTQQLAKNLFLKPERTIERKVQEVLLAFWLEHKYTKDQILEMYLNRVYFGSGSYGVEAASRRYFGKSARNVNLAEAALLAGLLKAPSRLSPARDPKAAEARAQVVLGAMSQEGMIGNKEMRTAMSMPATRAASYWTGSENYVADRVMEELPELVGEVQGDIIVETTVDLTLQRLAESSIRRLIEKEGKALSVSQGALVSIDGSGAVRAMVGGSDYANSQFDRASEARRQPGSAFKPFVYLAALEAGRTPDSIRNDAPIKIGNWTPDNYKGKFLGRVTLTEALAKSLNSVSAQLTMEVGAGTVVATARRLGIESKLQANTSIALGTSEVTPLELTAAFVPFANGGYRPQVHFVARVTDLKGKVLYRFKSGDPERVVKPQIIGMMNRMMMETLAVGTARKAAFGWPAAGKTGTSQASRDAWFVGYTSNLTTGVWFGNDDGKPMKNVTGGSLPAVAWREFMVAAHEGVPVSKLPGVDLYVPGSDDRIAQPGADPVSPSRPSVEVGEAPVRSRGSARPEMAGGANVRPDNSPVSSIRRPSAEVGGRQVREDKSILDIIMGK